jgi:hypothetical protein
MPGEPLGSVSVHAGAGSSVICHVYNDTPPILTYSAGRWCMSITVSGHDRPLTDKAVRFARELADQAQRFAAECERLYAVQHGGDAGSAAA